MNNNDYLKRLLHNKIALAIEIVLTICIAIASVTVGVSNVSGQAGQLSKELEADYNMLFDSYITTFNTLSGQIKEKIKENPSFDEMNTWLQSKEESFKSQVGEDVYDGIAITYKGGFAHSWDYGDYSDYDPSTRPWYQQAQKAKGEVTVVAPYVTYLDESYIDDDEYIVMTIAQKYNDEISFDYDIKISQIRTMLNDRGVQYQGTDIMLYDKDGYILSSNVDNQYAHNISNPDNVISENLSKNVLESSKKSNSLSLKTVNGKWKLMYSETDSNSNTMCVIYPFFDVLIRNFVGAFIITVMLIGIEILLYRRNKKNNREFQRRDIMLSKIIESSYESQIFVEIDNMTLYGSKIADGKVADKDYKTLYNLWANSMYDIEDKVKFEKFLSPKAIASDDIKKETLTSQKFNVTYENDGEKQSFVYEISRMVTEMGGKLVCGIFANDVTEDAKILRDALNKAQEAYNSKTSFLARMSHEIRTPMNAIIGETTIAGRNIDNPAKVDDCLDKVMIASKHLLSLINDILDMSAIENDKMKIANAEFDIKDIVSTVATLYYSQCKEKGVIFKTHLESVTTEFLIGDQLRIQQIILNLLSNAYKFTNTGGEIIFLLAEEHLEDDNIMLKLKVRDTGCGMSEEFLKRVFKPFEQATELTAKEHGGSGLGLSITKNLVELMHGKISIKSEEGKGTEFSISIPTKAAQNQQKLDSSKIVDMRAIIVDDDVKTLDYAAGIFNHIGIKYDCVENGEDAINIITKARNDKKMYDLCLVDWKMKGINGLELAKKIRQACGDEPIVIIASAYDINEINESAAEAGVDACLSKPLFQSSLFDVLMSLSQGKLIKQTADPTEFNFSGQRVLLVDDNKINRKIAKELLHYVGFEVDTANDGLQALEVFEKSDENTYQCILMDVQMPVMNGYDATRRIRICNHPRAKDICIIAMTANAFAQDIAMSIESGMNDHVSKPIDTEVLYEVLGRYLLK